MNALRLLLRLLIAAMCAALFACARVSTPQPDHDPPKPPVPDGNSFSLWIGTEAVARECAAPAQAAQFFRELRARRVDRAYVQVKDERGRLLYPCAGEESLPVPAAFLDTIIAAANDAGIEFIADYPLFLGPPSPGEEMVSQRAAKPGVAPPPRRSPLLESVRQRELAALRDLARPGISAYCLSHAGYPGEDADFSPQARAAFESAIGMTVKTWPTDVVTCTTSEHPSASSIIPGPLWDRWLNWRAGTMRRALFDAEAAIADRHAGLTGQRPPTILMTEAYYPLHFREGINWAAPATPAAQWFPDAGASYRKTGVGSLFSEFALVYSTPIITNAEAQEAGLAWWSSIPGATDIAMRVLPRGALRTAVVPVSVYSDSTGTMNSAARERFRAAIAAAAMLNTRVLVLDYDAMEKNKLWPDVWNALDQASAPSSEPSS